LGHAAVAGGDAAHGLGLVGAVGKIQITNAIKDGTDMRHDFGQVISIGQNIEQGRIGDKVKARENALLNL
jgi:hypothetical protein